MGFPKAAASASDYGNFVFKFAHCYSFMLSFGGMEALDGTTSESSAGAVR
jgi:hypothetical protein